MKWMIDGHEKQFDPVMLCAQWLEDDTPGLLIWTGVELEYVHVYRFRESILFLSQIENRCKLLHLYLITVDGEEILYRGKMGNIPIDAILAYKNDPTNFWCLDALTDKAALGLLGFTLPCVQQGGHTAALRIKR